jgi:4-amino-4-deoxy-L-arabinose transferase-like glycosyltransferase
LPDTQIWFHLLIWVCVAAFVVRAYKLDLQPLDDDEYASVQAILSILENGTPAFVPEDVYYTRSPLYHYFTAALALPFGGNLWSLRLQSVAFGVATAWLSYLVGARLMGSRWVGFFSMLLVAFHPYEVFTSHVIRFYQMQQFFALLTMYFFCRGFVGEQRQGYRIAAIVTFLMAVLSQEITIAMGPSIVLGYLIFAKDLGWKNNIQLALLSLSVVAIVGLDFLVFQTLCLTRTEGVSPSIEAAVKPHFWYPLNLLSILIGYSRLHVAPSLFLLMGLPLLWREQNRNTLALLSFLVTGVVLTNLLVTNVSLRYLYWLFPVWIVLSVDALRLCFVTVAAWLYPPDTSQNRYVVTLGTCVTLGFVGILFSWSPWRIWDSYELRILGDSTGAMRWIQSQKRPGDRVAVSEPHTHCAYLEAGKCDYDLAIPLLYDFAVVRDGVLVDRNGGGQVVSNLDQLAEAFSKGERIWIALNREKFRTRGKNLRWEYPGARFEEFIRKNCELKHRTYLWSVFLWDPARGHYRSFQLQE